MNWLWPIHTGITFFDYWTVAHIAFWFVVGSSLAGIKMRRAVAYIYCFWVAIGWEVFERFAESHWPTLWLSPESWLNSWVSDIAMTGFVIVAFWGFDKVRPQ